MPVTRDFVENQSRLFSFVQMNNYSNSRAIESMQTALCLSKFARDLVGLVFRTRINKPHRDCYIVEKRSNERENSSTRTAEIYLLFILFAFPNDDCVKRFNE